MELRKEQFETLALAMRHKRFMDRSDPGTGKTPPYCVWMWWQWKKNGRRTIWCMPKSIMKKNRREALKWSEFSEDEVVIVDGTPKQVTKLLASDAKVFIMGFQRFAKSWPKLKELHPDFDCVGVDEWHLGFKGPESGRSGQLFACMEKINHLYGLTGTFIAGGLDSAYVAIQLMAPTRYYFGLKDFYNQHAIMDPMYDKPMAWKNHEKIKEVAATFSIRRTFKETYGDEKKIVIREKCDMSTKQREVYDKFEKDALLELSDQFLDGSVQGVATIRCTQIMGHPERLRLPLEVYESGSSKPTVIMKEYNLTDGELTGKDERLLIHLEDHLASGEPLVIFSSLIPEQERIYNLCLKMGFKAALINGTVSAAKRGQIDEDFQCGKLQVVVGSPATATVGFNWGHVSHMIFVSLDYQDDNFLQAYRRAMRDVRETILLITILEYRKSIDQAKLGIIKQKSKDANKVDETVQVLEFDEEGA